MLVLWTSRPLLTCLLVYFLQYRRADPVVWSMLAETFCKSKLHCGLPSALEVVISVLEWLCLLEVSKDFQELVHNIRSNCGKDAGCRAIRDVGVTYSQWREPNAECEQLACVPGWLKTAAPRRARGTRRGTRRRWRGHGSVAFPVDCILPRRVNRAQPKPGPGECKPRESGKVAGVPSFSPRSTQYI